jgi:signal transduction histidine kinase
MLMPTRHGLTVPLRHLLILLSAVGLLPLASVGAWSIHAGAEYQQREQGRAALDLARALSGTVDAELDGTVATLSSMAHAPAMARGDIHAFYDIARAQSAVQPAWLAVILSSADGKPLFRTTAPFGAPAAAVADPSSLAQTLSLRRAVVGHIARGQGGRLAFPVRIPVFDDGGRLYVLSAVIRPERILRAMRGRDLPTGASVTVLDATGARVAHAGPEAVAPVGGTDPEHIGSIATQSGTGLVMARTRLSRYGWTVAVTLPSNVPTMSFAGYGAGIAASLALCIAVASLLAARIARRFERLQRETAALGAGERVGPVPSRVREIRAMGLSLEAASAHQAQHARERSELLASLEQASRAKDDFLAVLGHELRNPLSPIVAALDLMDLRDEPANRRERVILRRQVHHLKRLVDDLLDVSRIVSGKLALDMRPVELSALVRECAAAANRPVSVTAPSALWVRGDDSRLAQVLNNLLSNAARFGSTSTAVSLVREGDLARLAVSDNGVGMSRELLGRVFEPFYQAPQALARRTGGLGLGLAIVRRIAELHGGTVSAHSDGPGLGSRFEIELPVGAPEAMSTTAPALAMPGIEAACRVLLVDDNEDAAATAAALLEQAGHEVCIAHSAHTALAAQREFAPSVAILDIGLPDMDGYALAKALRGQAEGALRLVALSGYGQQSDVTRARAAGFDLHLTKPATLDDLRRATGSTDPA